MTIGHWFVFYLYKCELYKSDYQTAPTSCSRVKHCIRMIAPLRRLVRNHLFTLRNDAFTLNIETSDFYDHDGPRRQLSSTAVDGAVYLMKCPRGLCYVVKTKRELRIGISGNISNIRNQESRIEF